MLLRRSFVPNMLIYDELYWGANLHEVATCRYPEGGRLIEVQL